MRTGRVRAGAGLALALVAAASLACLAALPAGAQEKSFTFPSVVIDATVEPDGALFIHESRTYRFSGGTFTVGTFGIDWAASLIDGFAVSQDGVPLPTSTFADEAGFFEGEWDFPAPETGTQTFDISYRARCAVRVYTDVAHLYWQFVGTSDAPTDEVRVTVHLPEAATAPPARPTGTCPPPPPSTAVGFGTRPLERSEVKARAFGPSNGRFELPDPQTVVITARDLSGDDFVEGSIVFPPAAVPLAYQEDRPITDDELEGEPVPGVATGFLATPAARRSLALWICAALPLLWLALIVIARVRDRVGGVSREVTEPPERIDPVELAAMWGAQTGLDNPPWAYATEILHLARTGAIELIPVGTVSNPSDFEVRRLHDGASEIDRDFMDFLFGTDTTPPAAGAAPGAPSPLADGRVSLNSLRRKGSNKRLTKWSSDLKARVAPFVGKRTGRIEGKLLGWSVVVGTLAAMGLAIWGQSPGIPQLAFWEGLVVGLPMRLAIPRRLDAPARERMAPWKAFRRYLKRFSSLPDAPAAAIVIWEQYLEYAAALNVARRVADQIKAVAPAVALSAPWPGGPSGSDGVFALTRFAAIGSFVPHSPSSGSGSGGSSFSGFSSFGGSFSSGGGGGGGGTHAGAR